MPGALPDANCFGAGSADLRGSGAKSGASAPLLPGAPDLAGAARDAAAGAAAQVPELAAPASRSYSRQGSDALFELLRTGAASAPVAGLPPTPPPPGMGMPWGACTVACPSPSAPLACRLGCCGFAAAAAGGRCN